ncbi:MAG: 2-dehydropantoate 2-reductase [Burkholderiaceae bacterium]|nr:2-dehydropantoate 2-reductase [Burkholderiaceae bacterium]MEB2351475.1 2-dehydropantoate 2-reductase [Burkholderiaceae bacterium]
MTTDDSEDGTPIAGRPAAVATHGAAASAVWPRVAVYGAGAVGCFFGAKLAEAGAPVTLIGRPAHVEAIRRDGLLFDSPGATHRIRIAADTGPESVREAGLVLFCVKTRDTDQGTRALAPLLRPDAVVVSLQNGVDNVPRMRETGVDALAAVVYVATSMPAPGHLLHAGRGDLVIGEYGARTASGPEGTAAAQPSPRARMVAACFERAGVPARLEADLRGELWTKLIMNCAFNAISALARSRYGPMIDDPEIRALMRVAIDECVAVARAEGVPVADAGAHHEAAVRLGEAMREASSSTAQDLASGRPTEIDSLNGYVARRGQVHGVATPVNRALAALVRLLERAPHPALRA